MYCFCNHSITRTLKQDGAYSETMWAAQISQVRGCLSINDDKLTGVSSMKPYTIARVPVPHIRPNELLVKIEAAGYCHSDAQVLHGEIQSALPMIPSHEPVGVVVAVGEAAGRWTVGDCVGILNFKNACDQCAGYHAIRRRWQMGGFRHDGPSAGLGVLRARSAVAVCRSMSFNLPAGGVEAYSYAKSRN